MSGEVGIACQGNSTQGLKTKYKKKYGFYPSQEACGDCGRPRGLHGPYGFGHDFKRTYRKAYGY